MKAKRSTHAKGNYYRLRTKKWLEAQGYKVVPMEIQRRIFIPAKPGFPERVIFTKLDLWGADLLASNGRELIAVQVKTHITDTARGVRALCAAPWPDSVVLWVVRWPFRGREPVITDAKEGGDSIES